MKLKGDDREAAVVGTHDRRVMDRQAVVDYRRGDVGQDSYRRVVVAVRGVGKENPVDSLSVAASAEEQVAAQYNAARRDAHRVPLSLFLPKPD